MRSIPSLQLRDFLLLIIALWSCIAQAQTTRVSGKVVDGATGEPMPFVNVGFVDTRVSASTDFDGLYKLETYFATDSIRASCMGYQPGHPPDQT
jgi:CarboxypepD_reg-like domain